MMIEIRYLVFLLFFFIFCFEDIRKHSVNNIVFILYLIIGIVLISKALINGFEEINMLNYRIIIEVFESFMLGGLIYLLSIVSKEAIGKGDALYFIINGLYLSFIENILLFILGIFVSTIISIIIYIKNKGRVHNTMIPFIPCLLPIIIWRLVCIL